MHGHSISTGIAFAGLVVGIVALIFQVLAYRREK
jgi:multisubunit Na+/H+ antiporter MnhB subunit